MAIEYEVYINKNDGFRGLKVGSYKTLDGKDGVVLQQLGTRVVHVYRIVRVEFIGIHKMEDK